MIDDFPAAPWSLLLKIVSVVGTVVLVGVCLGMIRTLPAATGSHATAVLGLAFLASVVLLLSMLFVVRGYRLDGQMLYVQRLFWSTAVDLADLEKTSDGTSLYAKSLRLFGNGGLFAFCGLFRNPLIGTYRAFVTNWDHALILHRQSRAVVISPADPQAFVRALQRAFPRLRDTLPNQA